MKEGGGGRRRAALLLVPMLLLGAAFCLWTLFASVTLGEAESFIPAPLGSDALANYGEDGITGRLRSLSISIVEAVIRDRDPEEEDVGSRVDDVSDSLKSPVPTVTPKPGDPTGTPTSSPTLTLTPDLTATGTATPTATPLPSPTRTPTAIDVPTAGPSSTAGPTATPSNTPICTAPPYIEIISPLPDQRFTLAEQLPGQAFAFDPDNVNPLTCSTTPATFPDDDGDGIVGSPEVEMRIEWWSGSSWMLVHTELEASDPYCAFTSCTLHDLSSGEWPDAPPISITTGKHRLKAMVLQDDEGVASGWVWVEFYIDPANITVEDVSTSEGSGLTFTVTLDIAVPSAFTVNVSLTDVTATGGATPLVNPEDYDNVVAALNFAGIAGETQQFTVETLDDAVLEGAETFTVSLNAISPWVTDTDTGTGTIADNDTARVTVDNVTDEEGTGLLFTVTLDNAVSGAFNVNVSLAGGTATGGAAPLAPPEDYDNVVTALNFAGSAGETRQFAVATLDDAEVESIETFTVSLNATNPLVIDTDTGTGTITDNDIATCPDFELSSFNDDDNNLIWWTLTNMGASPVTMDRVEVTWTNGGNITKIELDGSTIWTGSGSPTYEDFTSGEWTGVSRLFNPSEFRQLRFTFAASVSNNYKIDVHSDNGCVETKTGDAS